MAVSFPRCPFSPIFPINSYSFKPSTVLFHNLLLRQSKNSLYPSFCSGSPSSPFTSEQAVLEAITKSNAKSLPAVRTYENDLARLTVVGSVDFQQALTAAAADGGEAADEHVSSGTAAMVVETIFPGPFDEHSTVSTRLFLPARKVKEKAIKLKKSLTKDIFATTTSKNILAMTFRQVVLQQLWNFELKIFSPGTDRDMNNLKNSREVPATLNLSSSDKQLISVIAEVICRSTLVNTERNFLHESSNRATNKFFHWFRIPKQMSSRDSSVILYNLLDHQVLANAKNLTEKFNMERAIYRLKETKLKKSWWRSLTFSELEKIGGPEFCNWISECIPSYILKIDASKFSKVNFDGWKKSEAAEWEVILTHSQLVSLADALDMYYEDAFTLPSERLSCSAVVKPSNFTLNKGSVLKMFTLALASGIFLVAVSVLVNIILHHAPNRKREMLDGCPPQSINVDSHPRYFMESSKVQCCCVATIRRVKDYYGWPGEVNRMNHGYGAWIGELPAYLSDMHDIESNSIETPYPSKLAEAGNEDMKTLQDIASYQVVLSTEGNIIGFQPRNRVAVNNWAANPIAKELYGGKKLSPGFFEPGLRISCSNDVVVLRLLMSVKPESNFALVMADDHKS